MEIIRTLFIPGEKVLWNKVMSKESTNERNYVVTNRRIYKKHYKVAQSDFTGAPEHVLHVLGDILIIERIGIRIIRSAHKISLFLETEFEDELYRFYPFEKINKYEAEEIKSILLDTDNLLYEEEIQTSQQPYQQPSQQSYQQPSQQSYQQPSQQSYQQPSYIQDGNIAYGYQEEKRKREALEHKIKSLNDKIYILNQNIDFQKSLVEKSNRQLELKSKQDTTSQVKLTELNQKTRELEDLRNKIKDVSFYAQQDLEKKNREITSLKQNIAKLIRLHSASKPKQENLLPEEVAKEKIKLKRRKQKLKHDRVKLMVQRATMMADEKRKRVQEKAMKIKQKVIPQKITSSQKSPPIITETKEKILSRSSSSPSFSSHLKKELDQIISQAKSVTSQAKSVTSSFKEESLDLTEELHGISNQLMNEREKLLKELEVEMDSIEDLSQNQPSPITIISEPTSDIDTKSNHSRVVKVAYGRRTCPVCGNQDKYPIKEVEDKDNIISYSPRIYGKKFICSDCTAEWRQENT